MSKILNIVVRPNWGPNLKITCVHRREFGGVADAAWTAFCHENPDDPVVRVSEAHVRRKHPQPQESKVVDASQ